MKRFFLICVSCLILVTLVACSNENEEKDVKVVETATPAPALTENSVVSAEEYVGEYNSYDVDEPDLEIQRNEDGTYTIQIGIFRLVLLDECEGEYTEEGIIFSTDDYAMEYTGKPFRGIITLEDDVATVTFTSSNWKEYSDLTEYKYYKVSDIPKIKDYNY